MGVAAACGADQPRRASNAPTNTSSPAASAAPVPAAGDPGPGPTSIAGVNVSLSQIATLDHPLALVPRSGGPDLYVAEQGGKVKVLRVQRTIDPKTNAVTRTSVSVDPSVVLDLSAETSADGERGLLGIVFSSDGQHLYADYTDLDGNTHVVDFPMNGDRADARNRRELLEIDQPYPNHNGGSLAIGPDGFLYIGMGDGGDHGDPHGNAQNTSVLLGKVLRIDPDAADFQRPYGIPDGNPFAGPDGSAAGGAPEIWLYGVRNPWRLSFDRTTGDLWIADVGQDAIEEIDLLPAFFGRDAGRGANLGWNLKEGDQPYGGATPPAAVAATLVDPILQYDHQGGNCAAVGGYVYRGTAIPALQGVYVFGDYCVGELRGLLERNGTRLDERSLGASVGQGLTSFGQDTDGELYVLDANGGVYRIEPA